MRGVVADSLRSRNTGSASQGKARTIHAMVTAAGPDVAICNRGRYGDPATQRIEVVMSDTTTARPRAGRYQLDPDRTSVTFHTRHLFGLGAVAGSLAVAEGVITVDPEVPSASVTVTMSVASFDTGNRVRDWEVRSARFLDPERHPDITFRASTLDQREGSWVLAGELEVRGVRRPVTLVIDSVEVTETGLQAHATTRIDRYAFGLRTGKGLDPRLAVPKAIGRYLDIELTVAARAL